MNTGNDRMLEVQKKIGVSLKEWIDAQAILDEWVNKATIAALERCAIDQESLRTTDTLRSRRDEAWSRYSDALKDLRKLREIEIDGR